ncbi:hypothetical protein [Tsukamurella soli]|uniref:Uncharacterized protein n=1 Tax=Tsukamurella soli TaxID=644556 RepID=A0ABP8KBV2_9ACTN
MAVAGVLAVGGCAAPAAADPASPCALQADGRYDVAGCAAWMQQQVTPTTTTTTPTRDTETATPCVRDALGRPVIGDCDAETAPVETTTTAPPEPTGTGPAAGLHDLLHLHAWLALIVAAILLVTGWNRLPTLSNRRGTTVSTVRAEVAESRRRITGWSTVVAALPVAGFGLEGLGFAALGLLVAVPCWVAAARRSTYLSHADAGLNLAQREWAQACDSARAAAAQQAAQQAAPHDDLGLGLTPEPVRVQLPPEPQITLAQAHARGVGHAQTGGFSAPTGSAAAALLDQAGRTGPAAQGLDSAVRQLKLGSWNVDGDTRTWTPWITLAGVTYAADGDAVVRLELHHAGVDEASIQRMLPSLLRAWRCRSATVARDTDSGLIEVAVTNTKPPAETRHTATEEWT